MLVRLRCDRLVMAPEMMRWLAGWRAGWLADWLADWAFQLVGLAWLWLDATESWKLPGSLP